MRNQSESEDSFRSGLFPQTQEPCLRPVNGREKIREDGAFKQISIWLMKYTESLYQSAFISALSLFLFGNFSSDLDNKIEGLHIKFSKVKFVRAIQYPE